MIADALRGLVTKSIGGMLPNKDAVNTALNIYGSLKDNPNYMGALQSMAATNPLIAKAVDYVKQNGGNDKAAFLKIAEQAGIDPNAILKLIK